METTSGHVRESFWIEFIKLGNPTLNVGGTIPWAGALGCFKLLSLKPSLIWQPLYSNYELKSILPSVIAFLRH